MYDFNMKNETEYLNVLNFTKGSMTTVEPVVNISFDNTSYMDEFVPFAEDDSYERKLLTYYLMGVGGMTVSCLGIIGNILCVIVLTTKSMRSSTYMYLAALAVCDTLVLIVTMLLLIKDTRPPKKFSVDLFEEPWYAFIFPYVHPIAITFQVTSIWLTLAFTVDRFIMICHPFRAESMCSRGRARKVILALGIAGIIFNVPRFFEYYTLEISYQDMSNRTMYMYMIELTEVGNNEYFKVIVHSWLYLICVCGLPFLTLAVLNAFLIRAVHESRKKGKEINAREKRRNDTTIMLIGVVVVFLICQGPALVSRMMWAFSSLAKLDMSYHNLSEVANFLVILNSAINIVPYYFFGKKFRKEFWRLFCSCFFDKEELRKMTRSFSISVADPFRKHSVASHELNGIELNGIRNNHTNLRPPREGVGAPLIGEGERSVSDASDCSSHSHRNVVHFQTGNCYLQILRVGVVSMRLVSLPHARPWLIHSYKNTRGRHSNLSSMDQESDRVSLEEEDRSVPQTRGSVSVCDAGTSTADLNTDESSQTILPDLPKALSTYEKVRLLARPWRKPEGHLNRFQLKFMLESVMMYIMSNPGVRNTLVYQKYSPYLQPAVVQELIEMLEDLNCLTRTCLATKVKATLFSKAKVERVASGSLDDDIVMYEPKMDCTFKLGQFVASLT